ncbi:MAG: hypothetical protein HZA89_04550, partial [Verrucomicrobia bacterium]|nr:hypothetical protein [Verrucomicrobiota bacterium]
MRLLTFIHRVLALHAALHGIAATAAEIPPAKSPADSLKAIHTKSNLVVE